MSPTDTCRRAFIMGLASAPVALLLSRGIGFESGGADSALAELRSVARTLLPMDSAAEIGRAYLHSRTDESLGLELVRSLGAVSPGVDGHRSLSPAELRARLAAAVRQDFRQRRIVRVRNWHLALTEARLCALLALPA
jgi:hypothetical protein